MKFWSLIKNRVNAKRIFISTAVPCFEALFFIVVSVSPPKIDIGDQCWDECYLTALPVTDHSGDPQQENASDDYLLSVEGMNLLKREKNRQI